jgi:DNA-directed RNA polymerase specialized sigma24 family protein
MKRPLSESQSAARERLRRSLDLRGAGSPGPALRGGSPAESPIDLAVGGERARQYEAALARLRARDRAAVVGRIELLWSWEELAEAFAVTSPGTARALVTRALGRLVQELNR